MMADVLKRRDKPDLVPCGGQLLGLGHQGSQLWNVDKIHSKNVIAIVHLLVALVRHYRAPIRLPENVFAKVVIVKVRWRSTRNGRGRGKVVVLSCSPDAALVKFTVTGRN